MNEFRYTTYAREVIFGEGALSQLADACDVNNWWRVMIFTSPSLSANGTVDRLKAILGVRVMAVYDRVSSHVQGDELDEALALADENEVDAVIGLGGGSPIGMAKAIGLALEGIYTDTDDVQSTYPTEQPRVPNIAIPTTYAGSEMTSVYGVTRKMGDGTARKVTVRDHKVTPKLVIYDPTLTLSLPQSVTAATGINALAHCIEGLYSKNRNPLGTATALSGIQHITQSLLRCYQQGDDLAARTQMFIGSHMAGQCLATVTIGVHHGTCHVLGGTAGVPHGVANAIILPHAIRFNIDTVASKLAPAGEAMGIAREGKSDAEMCEAIAQWITDWVSQMGLPQRIRDAGVAESLLPKLAENMLKSHAVSQNPKPVTTVEQAMTLLRAAW